MAVRSSVLQLSRDGISHIRRGHPDVAREDLVIVQTILDEGRVFQQGAGGRWIGFGRDAEGQLWFAAWRGTLEQDRAFCLTLHRTQARHAARSERRHGPPLGRGG